MDPPPYLQSCDNRCYYSFRKLTLPLCFLQLKKLSNSIPSAGTEPSESVEQAYGLNESDREKSTSTEKGKSLTNGFPNDGTPQNPSSAKRGMKRKIPSREEISKSR